MTGMIGNKTVLAPPTNVLQNITTVFIHDLYYYRMASRHEINRRMVGTFPCSKNKPQIFLFYVAPGSQKGQYCIQIQNNKEIRREEKERK